MACTTVGAFYSPTSAKATGDDAGEHIPRLLREVESLTEEVRQLRAACNIYSELVSRLVARQMPIKGELHGTV